MGSHFKLRPKPFFEFKRVVSKLTRLFEYLNIENRKNRILCLCSKWTALNKSENNKLARWQRLETALSNEFVLQAKNDLLQLILNTLQISF